jgi:RNA polymerase sigma-70 factor (ECF subfamily)
MELEQLSDEELVARSRAVAGTPQAIELIEELFRRHYARVARWCSRFIGDRDSAADLAQEIFAKVYRVLDKFQEHSKFSTWLYSVVRNECVNAVKARSIRLGDVGGELLIELADQPDQSDLSEAVERFGDAELARLLLNEALDETEKAVFALHFGEDLPLQTITRLLNLTNASGAKAYIVSSRRKLSRTIRRWLAREERELGEGGNGNGRAR